MPKKDMIDLEPILRFRWLVEKYKDNSVYVDPDKVKRLQQMWVNAETGKGKWVDVPTEVEYI